MRERLSLCRDWEFTERFSEAFSKGLACETVTVNLPHTCRETPYHYFDDQIYQMVCDFAKQGIAVIFISSELPEVINVTDKIYVLRNGHITGSLKREEATEEKVLALAMKED